LPRYRGNGKLFLKSEYATGSFAKKYFLESKNRLTATIAACKNIFPNKNTADFYKVWHMP